MKTVRAVALGAAIAVGFTVWVWFCLAVLWPAFIHHMS